MNLSGCRVALVDLLAVAERFKPGGRVVDVKEFGNGNINSSFLVTLDATDKRRFVLQRLNTHVFRRPEAVMRNIRISTDHIRGRLELNPPTGGRIWEVPRVLPTEDGSDHWIDSEGGFWRAISFIEGAQSFEKVRDVDHAREVGYALGMFHTLLDDLPPGELADTLEGFHITPLYLKHYDDVSPKAGVEKSPELDYCRKFVNERRTWAAVLEDAKAQGKLLPRIIHGDPKVDNVLIDNLTGQAVSIVDLDTVKPGLLQYDIGDCLRSACNLAGENTDALERVRFETDLCRAVFQGYLSVAKGFLTGNDFYYLYDSIRLIAFELGLRFLTDHLEGDVYFRVRSKGYNLARAMSQFRLAESIEAQERTIRAIIGEAV